MQDEALTQSIIGCAMRVHTTLGPGFLESVYQRALVHELTKLGLTVESENRSESSMTVSSLAIFSPTSWSKDAS